ncbi:MAG: Uma2 family endonuclease [Candidatus Contendobacter sp.]|nr:Uma2 family endonuclease [Candidatus Contendobacter sp.]MDS4058600.1 Uma2 family endonuclease [Candidatus Contendobacter sp.]
MNPQLKPRLTPEDYLAIERGAEYKSEYFNGEIFAMTGASEPHNAIVVNTTIQLGNQLKKRPCRLYANDLRVKVSPTGLYTYPDLVVVCGKGQFEDTHLDTLLNPTLIIEVLSDSTEAYDRGRKFEHYRHLDSLVEYVLIAQHRSHVESYRRQPDHQWLLTECNGLDGTLRLQSIDCDLALAEVYAKVELGEDALD